MKDILHQLLCCQNMTGIPDANSFARPRKKGALSKLTGKGWLYSGSWKKRYCVLDGTKFYFFESEKSKGSEKCSGVISLDYYDVCEEYDTKDKKAPYAFIIGTSVRGFFDNRHQFSASSKSDMQEWIRSVHDVITEARNSRSRNGRARIISGSSDHCMESESNDLIDLNIEPEQLTVITKDRVRGPLGRRAPQRKSMMPTSSPMDQAVQKQRSLSLSSPNEQNGENDASDDSAIEENKRISISMEAVDRDGDMDDDDIISPRSSSNYEIFSSKFEESKKSDSSNGIILPKKPVFGKLGGTHAALTKELELKLKSGMAPGGRKMPVREDTENREGSDTAREIKDLHQKINQQNASINNVRNNLEALEKQVQELSTKQSLDKSESIIAQVLEVLRETADTLNEVQEVHTQCEKVLEEMKETKEEHQELLKECRNYLAVVKELLSSSDKIN